MPLCTIDMSMYSDNTIYLEGILEETAWLEKVSSSSVFDSWSKHHSQMNRFSVLVPGVNAILPLIPEPVHTLNMQYHCMKIIMQTVNFLNPGQIPVDVSDQPVYALTKELQWRKPEEFGENFYFAMFGGLHLEHMLLLIHGELIQGSGLYEILHINNLSTIGTGAVVRANHIKQARYCLQVALCAIYLKLKDALNEEGSAIPPIEWLKSKAKISQMCNYWHIIMKLQIEILLFIRSIRESNFTLCVLCVKNLMKWLFASDHYNYARWVSVHLRDLTGVHLTCPDVFREFNDGHFSSQKTKRKFSKMALDQCYEQNNELIKGISGATHLLNRNDETSLERWETSPPELARLITEFVESFGYKRNECDTQHHETAPAFQQRFSSDVQKVYFGIESNPFQLGDLEKINNNAITYDSNVNDAICSLIETGERQFQCFWNDRLVQCKVPITDPIKKNSFNLPGRIQEKRNDCEKKLVYSVSVLTKMREALNYRSEITTELFDQELFGMAQSIAETCEKLILLMSVFPLLKEISQSAPNLVCSFGVGEGIRYYNVHELCEKIGDNVCKALPFFHAFTGCDTVSAFFQHGKLQFWDTWMKLSSKNEIKGIFQVK